MSQKSEVFEIDIANDEVHIFKVDIMVGVNSDNNPVTAEVVLGDYPDKPVYVYENGTKKYVRDITDAEWQYASDRAVELKELSMCKKDVVEQRD